MNNMEFENDKVSKLNKFLSEFICSILMLVVIAAGLFTAFYFKFGTTPIDLVNAMEMLSEDYSVDKNYSESDSQSLRSKLETAPSVLVQFTEGELVAFFNEESVVEELQGAISSQFVFSSPEIVDIDFKDIVTDGFEMVTTIKVSTTQFKNEYMSDIVLRQLGKNIPSTLYIESRTRMTRSESGYTAEFAGLRYNGLEGDQTESLINMISAFGKIPNESEQAISINENILKALIGGGSFESLFEREVESVKATDYAFNKKDDIDYFELYFIDTTTKYNIVYENVDGANNSNQSSYIVTDGQIILRDPTKNGYEFLGWYLDAEFSGEKIITIESISMVDIRLYARFEIITYTIDYNLNGGMVDGENPVTYTIITDSFTLINPIKEGLVEFVGWSVNGSHPELVCTIEKGTYGNLEITAVFDDLRYDVNYYIDGKLRDTQEMYAGVVLDKTSLYSKLDMFMIGMGGYSVDTWYKDKEMTDTYEYDYVMMEDINLYGTSTYVINDIRFYDYLEKFDQGVRDQSLTIKSHEEMVAYVDYVRFYDIKTKVNLNLSYNYGGNISSELQKCYDEVMETAYYKTDSQMNVGSNGLFAFFYIDKSNIDKQASKVMDPLKSETFTQTNYALEKEYPSTRTSSTVYNIDRIERKIEVSTSEQLVWALENGYNPVCKSGSKAESIYKKARNILMYICDDDMPDEEKLSRIYEWLIMNNTYDNKGFDESKDMDVSDVREYDSWFAEGIFNSHNAVCEGFCKALLIMARIEGIPAIIVTGNSHAWNRVMIDGIWYGIDATHGNVEYKADEKEVLDYTQFMFTDEYKAGKGYSSKDYSDLKAVTAVSYFEMDMYETISLNIGSEIEKLKFILSYIESKKEDLGVEPFTIELLIDQTLFQSMPITLKPYGLELTSYNKLKDSKGNTIYVLFMNFTEE